MDKRIAIGADHGGFDLKEKLKASLERKGYRVEDVGTHSVSSCDYPEYGFEAARKVSERKAGRAIAICKTGIGMSIIANKLPGVRAGLCSSAADAVSAREHNDTNVLVLAASKTGPKKAKKILEAWLKTGALGGRHARRVRKIRALEKELYKSRKR